MEESASLTISAILISLLLLGCTGPSAVKIDESANEARVNLQTGQRLSVTLKSNPTTGYDWQIAEIDEKVLRLIKQEFEPASDPEQVGAPGHTTYEFEAVGSGAITLDLVYVRPWEEGAEPEDTFRVQVTVE